MRIPYLISSPEALKPAQAWQLVQSLYGQTLSLVESSAALIAIQAIALMRTGWIGFAGFGLVTIAVAGCRLIHVAWFHRCAQPSDCLASNRIPETWARDFMIGALAHALLWSVTGVWIIMEFPDPVLQALFILVLAGWLGVVVTRNSTSPAVVYGQTLTTVIPCGGALALQEPSFIQIAIPFMFIHLVATLGTARHFSRQNLRLMESERLLSEANEQLEQLSATDGLTGISNRRALDAKTAAIWSFSKRAGSDVALLMVDVDYFKLYNDRYGHLSGDDCLRRVASCLTNAVVRGSDAAGRYGGEEFAAVLPGTSETGACQVAERLRQAILAANIPHEASPAGQVTISIGVACMMPLMGDDPSKLFALADKALYEAKESGRNQVRAASGRHIQSAAIILENEQFTAEPVGELTGSLSGSSVNAAYS